jgi:hypothetical protein
MFTTLAGIIRSSLWPEFALLGLISLFYGSGMLSFDPTMGLPGGEFQFHVGFMELFSRWLNGQSEFPLWNPVAGYGRSLIADPFLFFFNPFISGPMAILGIVNGTKVAVVLHLFIGGLGTWFLARVLGFERQARLWCSLLFMMSGAFASHLTAGQIQLSFSLSWLPWSITGLIWVFKNPSLIAVVFAAIAQALFFFSGNLYHQVYGGFTLLLIGIVFMVDWDRAGLHRHHALSFLQVGVLTLGLIAIQLLPLVASYSSIRNTGGFTAGDHEFPGSQLPEHAILNYVVSDPEFQYSPILDKIPILQENYRFIGLAPFLLLLFLVPAFRQGNRREIIAFAASFVFLLSWASIRYSFVKYIYDLAPFLYQFRFPGRSLSVGTLFLVMLSGFGLNYMWISLRKLRESLKKDNCNDLKVLGRYGYFVVSAMLVGGMILGLRRVYVVNREMFYQEWIASPDISSAVDWLIDENSKDLTVNAHDTIAKNIIFDAYRQPFRVVSFNDGWRAAGAPKLLGAPDTLQVRPSYQVDWEREALDSQDYELAYQVGDVRIWHDPGVHPNAFLIPLGRLNPPAQIAPDDVISVISRERIGINSIAVDLKAPSDSVLVVTESWFNGWKVTVDGEPENLISVSNFLAVRVSPGRHAVIF